MDLSTVSLSQPVPGKVERNKETFLSPASKKCVIKEEKTLSVHSYDIF